MTVLTKDVIKKEILNKNIIVTPTLADNQIGPASIDLTLSNDFRIYKKLNSPVEINADYKDVTEELFVANDQYLDLKPNEIVLGITLEEIQLSPSICGLLEGRSRFARLGLLVHFTASIMAPGIKNRQVLEICNLSQNTIRLRPGAKICQFMFLRCEGEAQYNGQFQNQNLRE